MTQPVTGMAPVIPDAASIGVSKTPNGGEDEAVAYTFKVTLIVWGEFKALGSVIAITPE